MRVFCRVYLEMQKKHSFNVLRFPFLRTNIQSAPFFQVSERDFRSIIQSIRILGYFLQKEKHFIWNLNVKIREKRPKTHDFVDNYREKVS